MSDHGDHAAAAHDLTDLYVFPKPGDRAKTILVMDVDPDVVPGEPPPGAQPFDPDARYDFMIDADGDAVPDSAFRITFSNDDAGRQTGTVRRLAGGDVASSSEDGPTVLHDAPVSPATEPLITVEGGIAFSPVAGAIRFSRTWWADGTTSSGRGRISWRATMYP